MGNPDATEDEMWAVLEQTNLAALFKKRRRTGYENLRQKASNLSGGQCQRLALARALLHDSPVYIFDEATSNIDVESENDIMEQILLLAKKKSVLLISHRLANITKADIIYAMEQGEVKECGTHEELLRKKRPVSKNVDDTAKAGTLWKRWCERMKKRSNFCGHEKI